MSIFKVNQTDFQSITINTNPSRHYSSSSSGITGSVYIFPRRSGIQKDIESINDPETPADDSTLFGLWNDIKNKKNVANIFSSFLSFENGTEKGFLKEVNDKATSEKKQKTLEISRFTPTNYFTTGTLKKLTIKDNLSAYYRNSYPSAHWGYCNYHSLNFFSSSTVTTSSVLLYPNISSRYLLTGAFSLDFHINPRYNTLDSSGYFKAGTIFHLSSSYALSLITGSAKNLDGKPSGFRLQLQLERSSNFSPSSVSSAGLYPKDLVFLSEDNSLSKNHWHHVVVRWGTNKVNHGTGSFVIDGIEKGTFVIPSSSLSNPTFSAGLCIGNYYEGNNLGTNSMSRFFANIPANNEGLYKIDNVSNVVVPDSFTFRHPLQAEVHDLSIKRFYTTNQDITSSGSTGISDLSNVAFYVPPFFTFDSQIKGLTSDTSRKNGVVYTPAIATRGMTTTPFSVPMAFGVDGHYINTENFLKDFTSNYRPRQLFLSATLVNTDPHITTPANEILYDQPAVRKRNLLILPCDDGNFYPNYQLLSTGESIVIDNFAAGGYSVLNKNPGKIAYVDDLGNPLEGFISLNNMAARASRKDTANETDDKEDKNYVIPQIGFRPSNPLDFAAGNVDNALTDLLSISNTLTDLYNKQENIVFSTAYRTADGSSNQVVFFDISNLYYGTRILPGSFVITDSNLSGSGGAINITIKDNGNGTLYRADSLTPHCTWNSVGTIFYNEGIIVIKNPHLYFFGKNQYEISFKGEQNLHVLKLEVLTPVNHLNSSSNPSYKFLPSSNRPNEPDKNFVYVSGINFHDDNLNVIMKTQLAQPIMKRHSEKLLFKIKYDF
jgi:hypothetical protein